MNFRVPQLFKKKAAASAGDLQLNQDTKGRWSVLLSWSITGVVVVILVAIGLWLPDQVGANAVPTISPEGPGGNNGGALSNLPGYTPQETAEAIFRYNDHHTDI